MKKLFGMFMVVTLLTIFVKPGSVKAADVTTYSSGFQVQNLNQSDSADITISYYNMSDGSLAATTPPATIPAGGFSTFFTLDAVSAGFDGSAVIESDQPVAVVSLLHGNGTEHIDAYTGFSDGATDVFLPLIQKNNYGIYTWFNVQNTGSSDAHITVSYPGSYTGAPCEETATITPHAAVRFDQTTDTCLPDGVYAATITSDQPVAAVVVEVPSNTQTLKAMVEAYTGFTSVGVTNPVFPSVSSGWYGSVNGIRIMNTGSESTDVTLSFTPSAGFPGASCSETKTIAAGQSVSFANEYSRLMAPECRTFDAGTGYTAFVGVGRVTGNTTGQTLVGISHQNNSINAQGATYDGFDEASATTSLAFPIVIDRYDGGVSGMVLYNAGSSDAHVLCTFTGTTFTLDQTIAPGTSTANPLKNQIADSYLGSAICTSDQPILGVGSYNTQLVDTDGRGSYRAINY